ncbi:MAG: bifunctional DNA primase/polymerase [Gammaproteobacteria bacterium]|nr:bifunctional DNA primase/polymerase [Gammaproteobacteria bacterium]
MTMLSTPSTMDMAVAYTHRGWRVLPIPYRDKKVTIRGWQQWRLDEDDLPRHFPAGPSNLGVLLGEPSGWLVDVDLDHPRAVELADDHLPATDAMFGRPGKPRSHRLYVVTAPVATKKHRSASAGMIVELRSTGSQTVFPPSVHESGELIEWEQDEPQPAVVDPAVLLDAVKALADRVKIELGEKPAPRDSVRVEHTPPTRVNADAEPSDACNRVVTVEQRFDAALRAMLAMGMVDHNDGSSRLFAATCRCVEHDLADDQAVACIRTYAQRRPFPRRWSDADILRRLRDAEGVTTRGQALMHDEQGLVPLGQRDLATGKLVLSPRRTLPTARAYVRDFHDHPEAPTLRTYADLLMAWRHNRYVPIEDAAFKHRLQPWLHDALRYVYNKGTKQLELLAFESNPTTVNQALETIRHYTHLDVTVTPPAWLEDEHHRPAPHELLPCRSLNLHIPSGQTLDATPALFTTNALDFDYAPEAPAPIRWLRFLDQLWPDDPQSLALLQEWFGYCLTPDTRQQKMLLIVGPRRSGKGTIGRVLSQLVGPGNVCGPTTTSLAGTFGLQPLIGKSLAVVSDARFHGDNILTVIERILCISGEDTLTIDRKHLGSVTMKLPTRFVFFTNELPRLTDASGALAGRFLTLRLTRSFYGQEDMRLTDKLLSERPGILKWALEGWTRLRERGHFVQPDSVRDAICELEDLASPVGAFVRDCCVVGAGKRISIDDLYRAWRQWCQNDGRSTATTKQTFGRDLATVVPGLRSRMGSGNLRFYEGIGLLREVPCGV